MNNRQVFVFGDMKCIYYKDSENGQMNLMLLPAYMDIPETKKEKAYSDSLVQLHLVGDVYASGYSGGRTLRQAPDVYRFVFENQEVLKEEENGKTRTEIITTLRDDRNYVLEHHLVYRHADSFVTVFTVFRNDGTDRATLEMLSSFSIGNISPYLRNEDVDCLKVHRIRSVWSMEGRAVEDSLEDLQLETSWTGHAVRSERFGSLGSMPLNGYHPYLVMEDSKNQVYWGAMLAHNASWQMEIYRRGDGLAVSGGIADRDFGHWMKHVDPGESFVTPTAILSVCKDGGLDRISARMTAYMEDFCDKGPRDEQDLPIIFNDYCTTWGCPSHENIENILKALKGKGISYFVIDCGWYKPADIGWSDSMGDYEISKELFPDGLLKTSEMIREYGFKPGIWFEIENVAKEAKAYQYVDHLLTKDGVPLTTDSRRFWKMTDPWVWDYLDQKVIGTLRDYGFEYMKIDYNDSTGIGCDGAESLGEALRLNQEASVRFLRKVKNDVPGIVLENCASGGHRLEPLMMSECAMASFSDAHECPEIPILAANLHRVILPRQSQIWTVIRETDSKKRIAYSLISACLGRMCFSGDVLHLSKEQWSVIEDGIAFYKKIAPIIKKGETFRFGTPIVSYRHPKGWQGVLRVGENGQAYALFHYFERPEHLSVPNIFKVAVSVKLPTDCNYEIESVYSDSKPELMLETGELTCMMSEEWKAVAVLLRKVK